MDILVSFGALALLCAFLTLRCRLHSALAPLAALGIISLWLTIAGMAGLLAPAVWLLLAASAALGVWALASRGKQGGWRALFSPGAALFWALAVSFAVYFAIRQPLFSDFDEFSFWGPAAKLTCLNDSLYTTGEIGWAWQATQTPGLIVLSYFVQFLGQFAPWKVYLAYDLLLFACFAAVLGRVTWRRWPLAVPLAVIAWLTPWFFTVYNRTIELCGVYMTSYGDIPSGIVFGGAVAYWLAVREDGPRLSILPVLVLVGNIKSNTFVLALLAAGLAAADWLFFAPQPALRQPSDGLFKADGAASSAPRPRWRGLARRAGFGAALLAAPMAMYLAWGRYIAGLVQQNAAAGGMGETSPSTVSVAVSGIRMLLGLPVGEYYEARRAQFFAAADGMRQAFFQSRLSMLGIGEDFLRRRGAPEWLALAMGSGVLVTLLILLLLIAAAVLAGRGQLRRRIALLGALSAAGFVGYNFMLALSYGFIFRPEQAEALIDYNRYIDSFYLGWFLLALTALALALQSRAARPALRLLGQGGLVLLAALMLLRVDQMVLPQFSVLGFSDAAFADQRIQQARADAVTAAAEPGSRIFLVSQGDDGLDWFEYSYDLLPLVLDYSGDRDKGGGGGTFGLAALRPPEEDYTRWYYYHPYTAAEWAAAVRASGCRYIFVDRLDEIFTESYAPLFADGLAEAEAGRTLLYEVREDGLFAPVEMEVPA